MPTNLPSFPVDDFTLTQIEHSLGASYDIDEEGNHVVVGADFTLSQYLDFLSGYDSAKLVAEDTNGWYDLPVFHYPDTVYSERDMIRALIGEIRRLRDGVL